MAHFAEISSNNIVLRVLVVPDSEEYRGNQYLSVDLLLGGTWIQCSYNGNIRKQYPGPGYSYDPIADVFVAQQPYASWELDEDHDWQAPTPMPTDGKQYAWNEGTLTWVEVEQ